MDFDQITDRQTSESLKWKLFPKDVLPLWVADMDFQSPPAVIEALRQRVDHGIFGYGLPPEDLTDIVRERLVGLYNWQVEADAISFCSGVVTGINLAVRTVCQPGETVLFQTPAYPPFFGVAKAAGLQAVYNPLTRNGDGTYAIDFDRFEEQVKKNHVKAFILCNPQNPTGRVFDRQELTRLAEICLRHGVNICSDEIHCDFLYDGRQHIPIASLSPDVAAITMTFVAPSKTFNIAGLHASVGIVQNPVLRERLKAIRSGIAGYPCVLAMTAARAAYKEGKAWLQELLVYLQSNRDWLYREVARRFPQIKMNLPEGTFLAWLDCNALGVGGNVRDFFVEHGKVAFNDGLEFGPEGQGFIRMNFGTQKSRLVDALERMEDALKSLEK